MWYIFLVLHIIGWYLVVCYGSGNDGLLVYPVEVFLERLCHEIQFYFENFVMPDTVQLPYQRVIYKSVKNIIIYAIQFL